MPDPVVPVGRPLLPSADAIIPYLRRLDVTRRYANRGELVQLLEGRLSKLFAAPSAAVVSAASGTAALAGAILAVAGRAAPDRPLCLCPAYTFTATALAAEQCGYQVHFVDINKDTWAVEPATLARHPVLDRAGIVLATAPYGRRFSQAAWQSFHQQSRVPVVIDAAACAEALADNSAELIGPIPIALSLHATKTFAVGEGGAVICADPAVARATAAALNFGFAGVRETSGPGLNGKMSEYHAAVGLAELDGWTAKRRALRQVADRYRQAAGAAGVRLHAAPELGSCYVLFEAATGSQAQAAQAALHRAGIDHRRWYGIGLHREPHFQAHPRDAVPTVEAIAPRLIGLPVAPDLDDTVIARIVSVLAEFRDRGANPGEPP